MKAALTALGLARQDLVQSRAGLLPSASYNMQENITQLNYSKSAASSNPIFIANNGAHEYIAQGNVHENLSRDVCGLWASLGGAGCSAC